MPETVNAEIPVREQLLKFANDLPCLTNAKSKPESVVLAEPKRMAVFSGESGMATSPEAALRFGILIREIHSDYLRHSPQCSDPGRAMLRISRQVLRCFGALLTNFQLESGRKVIARFTTIEGFTPLRKFVLETPNC